MLDNLLTEFVESVQAQNNPPFLDNGAYDDFNKKKQQLVNNWKELPREKRKKYKNDIKKYYRENGLADGNSQQVLRSKNVYLLRREINERFSSGPQSKLLPISYLHFEQSILELVENMENTGHIRELYRLRKKATGSARNSGINASEAARVKNCMRQGRELYLAGKSGALMVKPLNYFYSVTAYAYALIILNNPIRYSLDSLPGSHGLNYIPDGMKTQVGGDMPQGTFSDLLVSFPTLTPRNADFFIQQDSSRSILNFFNLRYTIGVGTLLSMIPEIREYYRIATGNAGRTHPLSVSVGKSERNVILEFQIGDGERRPGMADVENAFEGFEILERYGKYIVKVPESESSQISAVIYTDARGGLWYIENPFFPVMFPEICVHFMLTNTLSNLMRYSPDHWGSVLLNEANSEQSLIARKYLSAFENKFPILLLRCLSKYYPYVVDS